MFEQNDRSLLDAHTTQLHTQNGSCLAGQVTNTLRIVVGGASSAVTTQI